MRKSNMIIALLLVLMLGVCLVACGDETINFTVTFDTQGGSEIAPIVITEGGAINLPEDPTKDGYTFDGWYLDEEFLNEVLETQTITDNITLYAKWTCIHIPVTDDAVEANCLHEGLTEGSHCSRCGDVIVAQEPIPTNKNHDLGEWIEEVAPTWEHEGVKGHYVCSCCNNYVDKNGDVITDLTIPINYVTEYFNRLWDATSDIGAETVAEYDDLAVSFNLGLAFETVDSGNLIHQSLNLGLNVDAILDRTHIGYSDNTAFKVEIYDANNNEHWITLYYFFNDPYNAYFDFDGRNIKVPFDCHVEGYSSMENVISALGTRIKETKIEKGDLSDKTIAEVITALISGFGKDWTLDTFANNIIKLYYTNAEEMLYHNDESDVQVGEMFEMYLGLEKDVLLDENGNLKVKNILTNETIGVVMFDRDKTTVNKNGGHTEINSTLMRLLNGISEDFDYLFNNGTVITLNYGVKNEVIDGFDIGITFGAISAKVDGKTVFPRVTISINDLNIGRASDLKMATDKTNYTSEVAVDTTTTIDVSGISLDLTALDRIFEEKGLSTNRFSELATVEGFENIDNICLDGKLEMSIVGKIDIANYENNTTSLKGHITYNNQKVVEFSLVDEKLAITLNQDAKVDGIGIVDLFVRCFGDIIYDAIKDENKEDSMAQIRLEEYAKQFFADDTHRLVNPDFKGIVIDRVNMAETFNSFVNEFIDALKDSDTSQDPDESATTAREYSTVEKVVRTLSAILPLIDTDDNKLTIDSGGSIGSSLTKIIKIWNTYLGSQNKLIEAVINADEYGILDYVAAAIKFGDNNTSSSYNLIAELLNSSVTKEIDIRDNGFSETLNIAIDTDTSICISQTFGTCDPPQVSDLAAGVSIVDSGWIYL